MSRASAGVAGSFKKQILTSYDVDVVGAHPILSHHQSIELQRVLITFDAVLAR